MTDEALAGPVSLEAFRRNRRPRAVLRTHSGMLSVTEDRIALLDGRIKVELPIARLRRIELVVRRHRPAVLVVVPDDVRHRVHSLELPNESVPAAAAVIALISTKLDTAPVTAP